MTGRRLLPLLARAKWAAYGLRTDLAHRKIADAAYRAITAAEPDRALSRAREREILAYAREVQGSARFAPWLRVYAAYAGEFRPGWIADNYFARIVLRRVQGPLHHASKHKSLSRRILGTDLIPDIAHCVRGSWIDAEGRALSRAELPGLLFRAGDVVFAKRDGSVRGRGVFPVRRTEFDAAALERLAPLTLQEAIRQAEVFERFTPESVATLRITTMKPEGGPARRLSSYVRLGRARERVVSADTVVRVPVEDMDGSLGEIGALVDWRRIRAHPDSGAPFAGVRVPSHPEAVAACEAIHDRLPHIAVIGWDVAIDREERVRIMEWNEDHPDIKFAEASTGPHFARFGWHERRHFAGA